MAKKENEQNARKDNALLTLLGGASDVTQKAAVVGGMFHCGTQTPPVVYVQSDTRLVVVAPDGETARELCETVCATLAPDYTTVALGQYGAEGKVWYQIDVTPKIK